MTDAHNLETSSILVLHINLGEHKNGRRGVVFQFFPYLQDIPFVITASESANSAFRRRGHTEMRCPRDRAQRPPDPASWGHTEELHRQAASHATDVNNIRLTRELRGRQNGKLGPQLRVQPCLDIPTPSSCLSQEQEMQTALLCPAAP